MALFDPSRANFLKKYDIEALFTLDEYDFHCVWRAYHVCDGDVLAPEELHLLISDLVEVICDLWTFIYQSSTEALKRASTDGFSNVVMGDLAADSEVKERVRNRFLGEDVSWAKFTRDVQEAFLQYSDYDSEGYLTYETFSFGWNDFVTTYLDITPPCLHDKRPKKRRECCNNCVVM